MGRAPEVRARSEMAALGHIPGRESIQARAGRPLLAEEVARRIRRHDVGERGVSLCRKSASGWVRWIVMVRARASVSIPVERSQVRAPHAALGADDALEVGREAAACDVQEARLRRPEVRGVDGRAVGVAQIRSQREDVGAPIRRSGRGTSVARSPTSVPTRAAGAPVRDQAVVAEREQVSTRCRRSRTGSSRSESGRG